MFAVLANMLDTMPMQFSSIFRAGTVSKDFFYLIDFLAGYYVFFLSTLVGLNLRAKITC